LKWVKRISTAIADGARLNAFTPLSSDRSLYEKKDTGAAIKRDQVLA
jgi:hypothetical protein